MRIVVLAFLWVLGLAFPAQARGPYGSISVAGWSGGAFTDDKTGEFSNCTASASYKSGINFGVVVSKGYSWVLAFTHPNWTLTPGQKFPVVLGFEGRNTFDVAGLAVSGSMIMVPMPDNSALTKTFRAAHTMSALTQGSQFQFSLDGTSVLLPALVNCVKTINAGGLAAAANFVVPANPPAKPVAPAAAPATASNPQPPRPEDGSAEMQFEAAQIASNFILKANLPHPSLLGRLATSSSVSSVGVAWKADNATGFVRIIPKRDNMTGLDIAAATVATDARECKSKFASARNSELVDSDVVFRGMSACEDSERSSVTEYFIFPRNTGGFVMFSVTTSAAKAAGQQPQGQQRDEMNAGLRKAAYTSIER